MLITAATIFLSQTQQAVATKPYRDKNLDLTFERPADWQYKKGKYGEEFIIQARDGSAAVVQIFKTKFRQPTEKWQELQAEVAKQMNRKVSRQWEEQILGVPLLLTKIDFKDAGADNSTVVGLLYTATEEKLNFRVNAPTIVIDEVEEAWRTALMSLRTLSGEMPRRDDPTRPLISNTKNERGQRIDRLRAETFADRAKAPNAATIFALGRNVAVTLPKGWTVEQNGDEAILRSPLVTKEIALIVLPGGMAQAEASLNEANVQTIDLYGKVTLRNESVWVFNKVGAQTITSLRLGTDTQGKPLNIVTVVGTKESLIWQFQYVLPSDETYSREKSAIDELVLYLALKFEA